MRIMTEAFPGGKVPPTLMQRLKMAAEEKEDLERRLDALTKQLAEANKKSKDIDQERAKLQDEVGLRVVCCILCVVRVLMGLMLCFSLRVSTHVLTTQS